MERITRCEFRHFHPYVGMHKPMKHFVVRNYLTLRFHRYIFPTSAATACSAALMPKPSEASNPLPGK